MLDQSSWSTLTSLSKLAFDLLLIEIDPSVNMMYLFDQNSVSKMSNTVNGGKKYIIVLYMYIWNWFLIYSKFLMLQEDEPDEFANLIITFISRNRIGPKGVEVGIYLLLLKSTIYWSMRHDNSGPWIWNQNFTMSD